MTVIVDGTTGLITLNSSSQGVGGSATNTALGSQALSNASQVGLANTAVGNLSLQSNTSGANNSAVGYRAGYSNAGGSQNVALGYDALYSNTSGGNNTAVGANTLRANTTSSESVAVGYYSNPLGTGQQNISIGVGAHSGSSFSGRTNIAIGYQAGNAITTGQYNVILGGNTGGDIPTLNNNLVLADGQGNLLYWNGAMIDQGKFELYLAGNKSKIQTGKYCNAGTANIVNATLATVAQYGANNRACFKVTVRAVSAVNNYGNTMVAYAYIDCNTLASNAVYAFAQDNSSATAWGSGLTTMSLAWSVSGSTATLQFSATRSGNYCGYYITTETWQLDGSATVTLSRTQENFN